MAVWLHLQKLPNQTEVVPSSDDKRGKAEAENRYRKGVKNQSVYKNEYEHVRKQYEQMKMHHWYTPESKQCDAEKGPLFNKDDQTQVRKNKEKKVQAMQESQETRWHKWAGRWMQNM